MVAVSKNNKFELTGSVLSGGHWSDVIARRVLEVFPDKKIYTCAAGISPSGIVHFGNFRDVITSYAVAEALKRAGKKSRCVFSWDNFDRFRKVPVNVPESFAQYIGMPLSKVPSPEKGFKSYAEYFQKPFEDAMKELGIKLTFIDQTKQYESGAYDDAIFEALKRRKEIAKILLSFMTEKGKEEGGIKEEDYIENYYPISLYSRFTGKDATKILSYDGETSVTYLCAETKKTETVDLSKEHIAKLSWKVDWPMRWREEGVVFEPGGHDHASPGGSYDTGSTIAREIWGIEPPVFTEYKFVGIQGLGVKMSGSKGNAISPAELLEIYEPEVLKWLYFRKLPDQAFSLAFDTEIYRQYDEFDKLNPAPHIKTDAIERTLSLAGMDNWENREKIPMPFKQAVALGQITQWNEKKVLELADDLGANYDKKSVRARLPRAKNWLEKYNEQEIIRLGDSVNTEYAKTLDEKSRGHIRTLRENLSKKFKTIDELEEMIYAIPKNEALDQKENAPLQREFFRHIYRLLINRDQGPRLSTFLWAIDRKQVLKLLEI